VPSGALRKRDLFSTAVKAQREGAPDELALAGAEHLDSAYIAGYERKAQFHPAADIEELRAHGLGSTSTLIDFGAGTGTFALAAAGLCSRVIAIDVSPAMIDALRVKVMEQRATNVDCVHAGFLSYEHEGAPVEFVYTRNALHHLPDFWKGVALRRMAGLLVPGGILRLRDLVFSFELDDAEARVAEWIEEAAAERSEDGWTREELEAHVREEYSTFTWLLEPLLERAGFDVVSTEFGTGGAYAAYVCRRSLARG
jgi:ubiquinone/menaquinone biosynthesis C-methylase UbiE